MNILNSLSQVAEGEESPQRTGTRSDFWQPRPRSSKGLLSIEPTRKLD